MLLTRHRAGWPVPMTVSALHHESHRELLAFVDASGEPPASVGAVIVPTVRPVSGLPDTMRLARELGCPLVVLCSRAANALAARELGHNERTAVLAVDIGHARARMPWFATTGLLAGTVFARRSDLSLKRNLGLLLARVVGWQRILFLDDDLSGTRAADIRTAAGLLDRYAAVALDNAGFPDNSVVCHAHRDTDGADAQQSFIGAGAMVVAPGRSRSFFPDIYNEDWFFLLGDGLLGAGPLPGVAVAGSVEQRPFDPYRDPDRAGAEELGDCLGEGLYWLLDQGLAVAKALESADRAFWRDALGRRRRFLATVREAVARRIQDPAQRQRMLASLTAARTMSTFITAELCFNYMRAWADDLERWRHHVRRLEWGQSLAAGMAALGIAEGTHLTPGVLGGVGDLASGCA